MPNAAGGQEEKRVPSESLKRKSPQRPPATPPPTHRAAEKHAVSDDAQGSNVAFPIVGVGASKRLAAVRWGVAGRIVWAWVLTIPCSALVAAIVFWVIG